jgi:probable O-glycosylation ligase (exosortase A-associated)
LLVFGSLPYIFKRPAFGMVMWIWISVMNPHSQGWGFARSFPFAAIIAVTMVLSMLSSKERFRLPVTPITVTFILFTIWMCITAYLGIHPDQNTTQLIKVLKIFSLTLVVLMLVKDRNHVNWLIWTVVVSIGYYGVKGGIFTLRSGGQYRVWGPTGTFIDGNNEIALALVMTIPLMYYLTSLIQHKWGKRAMMVSMGLCAISALASYSRGAAIAMAAMLCFLWLKSPKKASLGVVLVVLAPLAVLLMPSQWHERIDTINTYEQDSSAMGRINAWRMAVNLAADRPLIGGGFEIYDQMVFRLYAPEPDDVHAAHSIYFQVLGEHGYVGLLLYLTLGFLTWRSGTWVIRNTANMPELAWAAYVVKMIQVSLLGFMVGAAFLSLAYFDVPYYLMVAMIVVRQIVEKEKAAAVAARRAARLAEEEAQQAATLPPTSSEVPHGAA